MLLENKIKKIYAVFNSDKENILFYFLKVFT
jgi:hypothetical protein